MDLLVCRTNYRGALRRCGGCSCSRSEAGSRSCCRPPPCRESDHVHRAQHLRFRRELQGLGRPKVRLGVFAVLVAWDRERFVRSRAARQGIRQDPLDHRERSSYVLLLPLSPRWLKFPPRQEPTTQTSTTVVPPSPTLASPPSPVPSLSALTQTSKPSSAQPTLA